MSDVKPKFGPSYQYLAKVTRVIDGDTFDAIVDLGFRITHSIRIRVKNIDCPELRSKSQAEKNHGLEASAFTKECLPVDSVVTLVTAKAAVYNRWEADVYFNKGEEQVLLSEAIRAAGMEKRESYPE